MRVRIRLNTGKSYFQAGDICNEDDPFPIARHLIHKLELLAIQQFMSTLQIGPDEGNNARDESPDQLNKPSRVE